MLFTTAEHAKMACLQKINCDLPSNFQTVLAFSPTIGTGVSTPMVILRIHRLACIMLSKIPHIQQVYLLCRHYLWR